MIDLQPIATSGKKGSSPFNTIMMIILILPIVIRVIINGFKWGWIFPIVSILFFFGMWDIYGGAGFAIGAVAFIGSIWLLVWRVRSMRAKRRGRKAPRLTTPYVIHDPDSFRHYD